MAKDPLIAAADRSSFGSAQESPEFYDAGQDVTYIRGYSDKRQENARRAVRREKLLPIANRYQWVRSLSPLGHPDGREIASFRSKGYTFVTKDNLASLGIEAPASGQLDPATGRFTLGDTVLMFCPRDLAARNENVLRRATEERSTADATAADLHTEGSRQPQAPGQGSLTEATVSQEFRSHP